MPKKQTKTKNTPGTKDIPTDAKQKQNSVMEGGFTWKHVWKEYIEPILGGKSGHEDKKRIWCLSNIKENKMKGKKRFSIKWQLMIICMILVVLPVVSVGFLNYTTVKKTTMQTRVSNSLP